MDRRHGVEPVNSEDRKDQYRALLVVGAIAVVLWVIWSVGSALFPFFIGAILAYILVPVVNWIENLIPNFRWLARVRRTIAILTVYLIAFAVLVALAMTVIPRLVTETVELVESLPEYWETVREEGNRWSQWYEREVPEEWQERLEANVDQASTAVSTAGQRLLTSTIGTVRWFIGIVVGLIIIPIWLYYVLRDEKRAKEFFYHLWPEELREDVHQVARLVDRVLASYIRGQLFLGLVVGVITGIGMWIIGVQQPLALGVVAGILELVPILGPWLSFFIAAVVVLATDPEKILAVAILSLMVQQLENTFLVPRIQGNAVQMNPAMIMMLLVIGGSLWGLVGIIVIVPLAAVVRDIFIYTYRRLSEPAEELGESMYPADDS